AASGKMKELERTISLAREHRLDAAHDLMREGAGKALMDSVRRLIAEMRMEELSLLRARDLASEGAYASLLHTRLIVTSLARALLAVAYFAARREVAALRMQISARTLADEIAPPRER